MSNSLSAEQLRELARLGATSRLEELKNEMRAIEAFLGDASSAAQGRKAGRRGRRRGKLSAAGRAAIAAAQKARWAKVKKGAKKKASGRKRKGMSTAARKAVGERMKKYWASKRVAKSKGNTKQSARASVKT